MYEFKVEGMTCGSCAISIQKVIKKVDPDVKVQVDIGQQLVQVQSETGKEEIASLIEKAGYEVLNSRDLES
ncbi:heavy metal-associated domain-containing protein [Bdellovibrio sp. 22V]|uniref:heavy-metal-associated domain-containing protein n=1 Tax=Bdellovibrio TaxID=958 RepID=UPI0025430920|nr:heavy metal-associated domain-containing protein [Bdellovibrio sp. 22V]WII71775.1 heavy metal-associated domain-containing protein [Bdellovibrio sp. 22V]